MTIKKAIKYMLISTLAFASMNIIVKSLTNISAYEIVFFRSAGSLIFTFGYLIKNQIPILGNNKKLLITRGIVGAISMILFFMSTKYLPIGTAASIRYLAPIFAGIFAVLFLKDKIYPLQWIFFIMAFLGILILRGLDSETNTFGIFLGILSAVTSGLVFVIISKIGNTENPVVIVNYFMIIATIMGGVLSINHWVNPVGYQWLWLLSLGFIGYIGQVYMTKAFQYGKTSQVAPLKYIEVIFTLLLGLLLFNEIYTVWSILGITLIILALVLNILYKAREEKKRSVN